MLFDGALSVVCVCRLLVGCRSVFVVVGRSCVGCCLLVCSSLFVGCSLRFVGLWFVGLLRVGA